MTAETAVAEARESARRGLPKPRATEGRPKLGHGKRLYLPGDRVGGRRRYRTIVKRFVASLGMDWGALPEETRQLVVEVATLTVQREELDARSERGQPIDAVAYATIRNALARARADLAAAAPKPPEKTLEQYLDERAAAEDGDEAA